MSANTLQTSEQALTKKLPTRLCSVIVTRADPDTIAPAVRYGLDRWQLQLLTTGTG